ncbi:zinc knuckle-domain-containing protein [Pyronema omphalodes]|nr:zinc knuckle-domain-containing protein [Pyronema omphalodes]
MHRYRPYSSSASSSKATPTTQCQKCLERGHYTYECKQTSNDRPYISRPSRTQQLLNPKLRPSLNQDAPPPAFPLVAEPKGVADGILKKKEEEREKERQKNGGSTGEGRKRRRGSRSPHRRARSSSVSSYTSYSSSSSRSPSPPRKSHDYPRKSRGRSRGGRGGERSSSPGERSVRRKYKSSPGPSTRGRRLSPTDESRRTRSASRPRRLSKPKRREGDDSSRDVVMTDREERPGPRELASNRTVETEAPRVAAHDARDRGNRSPSPFTRRKMMTEAMNRA